MTDTWSHATERAAAPDRVAEPDSAPPAPAAEPVSWQPYVAPSDPPAPVVDPQADPLILEVEHDAQAAAPAAVEPVPSVYGRVEPQLEPMELTQAEVAPPAPTPFGHAPVAEPLVSEPPAAPEAPVIAPVEPVLAHVPHLEPAVPETPAAGPLPAESPAHEPLAFEAAAAEPLVAQVEKPVEAAPQTAEPVVAPAPAVVEPLAAAPVVAAPAFSTEPPPSARPVIAEAPLHTTEAGHGLDPVLAGFDHVVALAGYVLLFLSVFMFGVPALATVALAYAHKNDSHLLVRSHYRFQLRVFWTAILFGVLALGAAVTAGGLAVSKLIDFIHANLPGVDGVMDRANVGAWSGEIAGVLLVAAVTLGLLAVVWTLVASVFGFLRLLANRPIGHQFVAK